MAMDRCRPRLCIRCAKVTVNVAVGLRFGRGLYSDSEPSESNVAVPLRFVAGGPGTVPVTASNSNVQSPGGRAALPPVPPWLQVR